MKRLFLLCSAVLFAAACKTAPETVPEGPKATIASQDIALEQGITDFKVTLTGTVQSAAAARIDKADYELVIEGKVVKTGTVDVGVDVPAGGTGTFKVDGSGKFVSSAEELKAMSEKGGSLLAALRGKLHVKVDGREQLVDFARSKEVRVPRLPRVKMNDAEGARFSDEEVNIVFYLGVENPNPFPIRISGIQYVATVADKQMSDGKIGGGEFVSPSSTGVFEIQIAFTKETYGDQVKPKVKTGSLTYNVKGAATGELYSVPFDLSGTMKLNVSK